MVPLAMAEAGAPPRSESLASPLPPGEGEYCKDGKVWRRPTPRMVPMGFAGGVPLGCGVRDCMSGQARSPQHQKLSPMVTAPTSLPLWGSIIDDVWGFATSKGRPLLGDMCKRYDATCERNHIKLSAKKALDGVDGGRCREWRREPTRVPVAPSLVRLPGSGAGFSWRGVRFSGRAGQRCGGSNDG